MRETLNFPAKNAPNKSIYELNVNFGPVYVKMNLRDETRHNS